VEELREHLNDRRRGERLRSGVHIAILGAPNAGKSSLLNIMCQKPKAIVSPQAGTTRDVVESTLDIGGYPVVLSDTAGLRSTTDPVEQEGVRRAVSQAESADLKIIVVDSSEISNWQALNRTSTDHLVKQLLPLQGPHQDLVSKQNFTEKDTIIVMNKTDLLVTESYNNKDLFTKPNVCWVSCTQGGGIREFLDSLQSYLSEMCGTPGVGSPSLTQARHRHHLTECLASLQQFTTQLGSEEDLVFRAEALRLSLNAIGHITGRIGVEDILDVVFKDFCIGK
jgi:tRNA modification GTPase